MRDDRPRAAPPGLRAALRAGAPLAAVAAASVLGIWLLRHEAEADRQNLPTLGSLTPLVDRAEAAGEAIARTAAPLGPFARSPIVPALLLGAGLLVAVRGRERSAGEPDRPPLAGPGSLLLLLPLAVGLVARFHRLADVPAGYSGHAVVHHLSISIPALADIVAPLASGQLSAAARVPALVTGNHFGLMSLLSALGLLVTGTGFVATRLASALAGTLTILVAYRLGRDLEDRLTGLVLAALVATAPWHLSISRYPDLEHVLSPLHTLVVLSAYVAALRWGRLVDHVVAGAALGISVFVYPANLALPAVVLPHLLVTTLVRGSLRRDGARALLLVATFALPSWGAIREQARIGLLTPSTRTGYDDAGPLAVTDVARHTRQARSSLEQIFVDATDPWLRRPGGGFGAAETALLALGIGVALGELSDSRRRVRASLLLLALPLTMVPGILGPDPSFRRFLPTVTVALVLGALGLSRATARLAALGVSGARAAAVALLVGLALSNLHAYTQDVFVDAEETTRAETEMALFARTILGRSYVVIVCPDEYDQAEIRSWLELGAGDRLAALGGPAERWVRTVAAKDLGPALTARPTIAGRTVYLTWLDYTIYSLGGVAARRQILETLPQAREALLSDSRGHPAARVFRVGAPRT